MNTKNTTAIKAKIDAIRQFAGKHGFVEPDDIGDLLLIADTLLSEYEALAKHVDELREAVDLRDAPDFRSIDAWLG